MMMMMMMMMSQPLTSTTALVVISHVNSAPRALCFTFIIISVIIIIISSSSSSSSSSSPKPRLLVARQQYDDVSSYQLPSSAAKISLQNPANRDIRNDHLQLLFTSQFFPERLFQVRPGIPRENNISGRLKQDFLPIGCPSIYTRPTNSVKAQKVWQTERKIKARATPLL